MLLKVAELPAYQNTTMVKAVEQISSYHYTLLGIIVNGFTSFEHWHECD